MILGLLCEIDNLTCISATLGRSLSISARSFTTLFAKSFEGKVSGGQRHLLQLLSETWLTLRLEV